MNEIYTLGAWRVKDGLHDEFITAWKELGSTFMAIGGPSGKGTLLQSTSDPALFYSFGPWRNLDDVAAMRGNARAQAGIQKLRALCVDATPGTFRVVAESA
jgi:hypothetical protein